MQNNRNKYTKKQLENLSIQELRRIDKGHSTTAQQQAVTLPGGNVPSRDMWVGPPSFGDQIHDICSSGGIWNYLSYNPVGVGDEDSAVQYISNEGGACTTFDNVFHPTFNGPDYYHFIDNSGWCNHRSCIGDYGQCYQGTDYCADGHTVWCFDRAIGPDASGTPTTWFTPEEVIPGIGWPDWSQQEFNAAMFGGYGGGAWNTFIDCTPGSYIEPGSDGTGGYPGTEEDYCNDIWDFLDNQNDSNVWNTLIDNACPNSNVECWEFVEWMFRCKLGQVFKETFTLQNVADISAGQQMGDNLPMTMGTIGGYEALVMAEVSNTNDFTGTTNVKFGLKDVSFELTPIDISSSLNLWQNKYDSYYIQLHIDELYLDLVWQFTNSSLTDLNTTFEDAYVKIDGSLQLTFDPRIRNFQGSDYVAGYDISLNTGETDLHIHLNTGIAEEACDCPWYNLFCWANCIVVGLSDFGIEWAAELIANLGWEWYGEHLLSDAITGASIDLNNMIPYDEVEDAASGLVQVEFDAFVDSTMEQIREGHAQGENYYNSNLETFVEYRIKLTNLLSKLVNQIDQESQSGREGRTSADGQNLERQLDRLGDDSGTTPTQQQTFTIYGSTVGLLFDGIGNGQTRNQTRDRVEYPEAGWEYYSMFETSPASVLQLVGTIYVDGVPSTNPDSALVNNSDTGFDNNIHDILEFPEYPLNATSHYFGCTGATPQFGEEIVPNYSMQTCNSPSGNADAIAVMYQGQVQGFDFVNNHVVGHPTNNGWYGDYYNPSYIPGEIMPIDGVTINYSWNDNMDPNVGGYIPLGEKFDDLLYYKASTNTIHALTEETKTRMIVSENINPVAFMSFTLVYAEPYAPSLIEYGALTWEQGDIHTAVVHEGFYIEFGPPINDTTDILPGDTNVDGDINVLDIVTMVDLILAGTLSYEELAQEYPQADMNGDGTVNVLDVVTLVQFILNNPNTSSRDRQELQRQLDRLDGTGTKPKPIRQLSRNKKFRRR
tara:strand:+ start:15408 stop:18392 length:2985 start_codon:yes stop_codon:yes gene_type:complete